MDVNALVSYLDSHSEEFEKSYTLSKEKYLRIAISLFGALPNCNLNILETTKMNTFLKVAKTFLDKNEVFEDWKSIKCLIEFLLLNLAVTKEGDEKYFTLKLLSLLSDVLERVKSIHAKNLLDKKRIFDITLPLLDNNNQVAVCLLKITNTILRMEGAFNYDVNAFLQMIMKLFFTEKNLEDICRLSKLVLDKLFQMNENTVNPILRWIAEDSISYIEEKSIRLEIKKEILSLYIQLKPENSSELISKFPFYSKNHRNLQLRLMSISDTLWTLCGTNDPINYFAQEVFTLTVVQFLKEENMILSTEDDIKNQMRFFYSDNEHFPEKYFFFICHMQEKHCRSFWSPKIILRAIEDWYYNKQDQIDPPIFKSIIYLFPRLAIRFSKPKYLAWSNDILRTTSAFHPISELLSFCQIQLLWILKMGGQDLKMKVLKHWISKVEYHKILKDSIRSCRSERILLNLILSDCDLSTRRAASMFLQKLGCKQLSKEISMILPLASKEPFVFNCLILTRPGVPEREEEKLMMLHLMSIIIPSLNDNYILRAACIYINDLLVAMKKEPKCLVAFSKYISTVQFLVSAIYRTEEDVSKEILFLFKNLASIQVKYQYELDSTLEIDPAILLKGSSRQINRVLTIFPIILSSKVDPLIKFKDTAKLTLFYQILDFVDEPDKQENALKCLHLMLKNYDWLSFTGAIGSFLKIWCCEKFEAENSHLFMILIIIWLKKLIPYPVNLHPMVPISEIQNFFMRLGDINQINCCSNILRRLQRRKSELPKIENCLMSFKKE